MSKIKHLTWNFVTEANKWAIYKDGYELCKRLNRNNIKTLISRRARIKVNNVIHYGSLNMFKSCFLQKLIIISKIYKFFFKNYYIVSFFHGNLDTNDKFNKKIKFFISRIELIDYIAIPNQIMLKRLLDWGIDKKKIIIIKVGFDSKIFINNQNSNKLKLKYKIPLNKIVIGSFQKDGNGWGEGMTPKFIKGPDIFCKVIIELSKKFNIHVLLTGPSRGYVKKHLDDNNISYTHKFLKNYNELPEFYSMIDLYLMTAREEGGPKSIIECMSMKIPFVATKVGIVEEISNFSKNDIFCEIEDTKSIIFKSINILKNLNNFNLNINYDIIQNHDFDFIAKKYMNIYSKLNNQTSN